MLALDLTSPVVRSFMSAVAAYDQPALAKLLAPDAELTDDGRPFVPLAWLEDEVVNAEGSLEIDREEDGGTSIWGHFMSRRWSLDTVWRFEIAGNKISRLDISAA